MAISGLEGFVISTADGFVRSRKMFEKAIALDPDYADAYAWSGFVRFVGYVYQWDSDPHALDRAEQLAQKAVSLDDSNSQAYSILGQVAMYKRRPDQAIADEERAITLNPNNANAYRVMSEISGYAGKYEAQVAYAQKEMRLDPKASRSLFTSGWHGVPWHGA
jgi:tetratricopeptide (TPR) repeat protein